MLLRNCLPKCELAGKWTRPDVRGRVVLNQKRSKIQMFSRSKYCSDSLWPLTVVVAAEQGTGGTGDRWKTREGARRGSRKSDAHPPRACATSSWRKVCKWLCSHSAFVFVQPASDARISAPETRRQLGAPLSLSTLIILTSTCFSTSCSGKWDASASFFSLLSFCLLVIIRGLKWSASI